MLNRIGQRIIELQCGFAIVAAMAMMLYHCYDEGQKQLDRDRQAEMEYRFRYKNFSPDNDDQGDQTWNTEAMKLFRQHVRELKGTKKSAKSSDLK